MLKATCKRKNLHEQKKTSTGEGRSGGEGGVEGREKWRGGRSGGEGGVEARMEAMYSKSDAIKLRRPMVSGGYCKPISTQCSITFVW